MANSYTIFSGLECSPSTLYNEAWALVFYGRRAASWSSKTELFRPPLDDDGLRYLCASHLTGSTILTLHDGVFGRLFLETNVFVTRFQIARSQTPAYAQSRVPGPGAGQLPRDNRSARTHNAPFVHAEILQPAGSSPFPTTSDRANQHLYLWRSSPLYGPAEIFGPQTTWRIHFHRIEVSWARTSFVGRGPWVSYAFRVTRPDQAWVNPLCRSIPSTHFHRPDANFGFFFSINFA